ncbi:MAG: PEGA domain-containing protein [Rikenellaceae bacterium]|nr:PEGA domain-containing protein [Rikenellaceae bacterium]
MKKLLSLLTLLTVALTATAQITNSIVIDRSSFRAVQKDALTGANVDPIGVDHSRRACARLKIFFHKMTREQLAQLDAIFPSGTIEKTKIKVADYENILILEMTAKPQVAFYLKHPTFGTSNEVTLSLEGNKEYQIEATLNQTLSIVVNSNVEDAEVYLDGAFKGLTNSNFICTIADVMIGEHKLKVVYDNSSSEKSIEVNRNSISFRQNVDVAVATPQHVLFEVSPVGIDAMVQVAGVFLPIKNGGDGVVDQLLAPGNYQFIVTAPNYHPYSGEVAVRDKSVKASVILNPAFGILNINGGSVYGAEVYVDNTQQNAVSNLQLPSGEHTVRIIKSRYKPYQTVVKILDGHTVSITPTLEPNFASVTIKASSPDVEIWLNDSYKSNGTYTTELDLGLYKVEGRKKSHSSTPQFFDVAKTEPMTVELSAPEPIYGSLDISCNVEGAKCYVDGDERAKLPYFDNAILVGTHEIKITAPGYKSYNESVTIEEDRRTVVTAELKKKPTHSSKRNYGSRYSGTRYRNIRYSQYSGSFVQLGFGFDWGFGGGGMSYGFPVEMRLGRVCQLVNGFIGARYNYADSLEEDSYKGDPLFAVSQFSPLAKLRFNVRHWNTYESIYVEAGGMYNLNLSSFYKTKNISSSSSSALTFASDTKYKIEDVLNKSSVSCMVALGYGEKLWDISLYGIYNITPTFNGNGNSLSSWVVYNNGSSFATLDDYESVHDFMKSRLNIGVSVRIYLFSGYND